MKSLGADGSRCQGGEAFTARGRGEGLTKADRCRQQVIYFLPIASKYSWHINNI